MEYQDVVVLKAFKQVIEVVIAEQENKSKVTSLENYKKILRNSNHEEKKYVSYNI